MEQSFFLTKIRFCRGRSRVTCADTLSGLKTVKLCYLYLTMFHILNAYLGTCPAKPQYSVILLLLISLNFYKATTITNVKYTNV